MDVMSRSDDARLGLYVVARLSANLGLKVELRPSAFGGTRVVVLVPRELIADQAPRTEPPNRSAPDQLTVLGAAGSDQIHAPRRLRPESGRRTHADSQETPTRPLIGPWVQPPADGVTPAKPLAAPGPLPRRVRQASLATELREPARPPVRRHGADVAAFQSQSRMARRGPGSEQRSAHPSPDPAPGQDRPGRKTDDDSAHNRHQH
jgi:hypothetical protein